jgi:beta-hydroxylase
MAAALLADQRMIERHHPRVEGPLDTADHDWVPRVEAAYTDIRAELDQVLAQGVQFPETSDVVGQDQGNEGRWSTYMLCSYGTWLEFNCARMPITTEVVRSVPEVQIAGFAVLHAGSHLPRHRGPSKSLRYHLGVKVPGPPGSTRIAVGDGVHHWAEGVSLLFDDAVEHEAWNDSDEDRYVLFIERRWPLPRVPAAIDRAAQGLVRLAARRVPARAAELDRALNPG